MATHAHMNTDRSAASLNRLAALATLHCLTGCAIGEVAGMAIGTALGWSNAATIALAIGLAFLFGYSLTMMPLLRSGLAFAVALPLAFASDTFSIAVMEIVDNGVMLAVPGAMDAPLSDPVFWGALVFALAVAYVFALPVNRYLIARGRGHAVVHGAMHGGDHGDAPPQVDDRRRLIAIGLAAMAVTMGVAVGGALLIESGHDETPGAVHGATPDGHDAGALLAGDGAHVELGGLAVASDGYRLEIDDANFVAGRVRPLNFTVRDDDGQAVRDLDEHGGVRMHLIVVRRDMTGYQHLHPTLQLDGSWRTTLRLAQGGVYRAYADFERGGEKVVLGADLLAGGTFAPAPLPPPASTGNVDGYDVELSDEAVAGSEATLIYRIARGGASVDVEPYLGEAGHLVVLRATDLAYLHVHPMAERPGEVRFAATFPTPGTYRLFLQFQHGGEVHTVPLTLDVNER